MSNERFDFLIATELDADADIEVPRVSSILWIYLFKYI